MSDPFLPPPDRPSFKPWEIHKRLQYLARTHIHTYTHTYIYTRTYTNIYTHTHIYIPCVCQIHSFLPRTAPHSNPGRSTSGCSTWLAHTYTHIHTHIYIYIHAHTQIYTHTHTHIYIPCVCQIHSFLPRTAPHSNPGRSTSGCSTWLARTRSTYISLPAASFAWCLARYCFQ